MKNDDLNLDMLENADERTVERLSEEYRAVTEIDGRVWPLLPCCGS